MPRGPPKTAKHIKYLSLLRPPKLRLLKLVLRHGCLMKSYVLRKSCEVAVAKRDKKCRKTAYKAVLMGL